MNRMILGSTVKRWLKNADFGRACIMMWRTFQAFVHDCDMRGAGASRSSDAICVSCLPGSYSASTGKTTDSPSQICDSMILIYLSASLLFLPFYLIPSLSHLLTFPPPSLFLFLPCLDTFSQSFSPFPSPILSLSHPVSLTLSLSRSLYLSFTLSLFFPLSFFHTLIPYLAVRFRCSSLFVLNLIFFYLAQLICF
jgi:hypothetical protein